MRAIWAVAGFAVAAAGHAADGAETRLEQLIRAPAATAPAKSADRKADKKAARTEADSVAGLVGQRVTVETRLRGLYIGTLTAVTRDALILAIDLPSRSLSYSLPRADVASVNSR